VPLPHIGERGDGLLGFRFPEHRQVQPDVPARCGTPERVTSDGRRDDVRAGGHHVRFDEETRTDRRAVAAEYPDDDPRREPRSPRESAIRTRAGSPGFNRRCTKIYHLTDTAATARHPHYGRCVGRRPLARPRHVRVGAHEDQAVAVSPPASAYVSPDDRHRQPGPRAGTGVEGQEGEPVAERLEDVAAVGELQRREVMDCPRAEGVLAVRADGAAGRPADDRRALVVRFEVAQPAPEAGGKPPVTY
jgi:hypothetical protein